MSARALLAFYIGYEKADEDPHFERHLNAYRAEVLREAAGELIALRDTTDVNVALYARYDAKGRAALDDAVYRLRRMADEAATGGAK